MESIAYQELALTWEAATELESFQIVDWKKLSAEGFIRFVCLCVTLSVLTAAKLSLAQTSTSFPLQQGQPYIGSPTITLPSRGFFQRGDRNAAVTALQQVLQNLGYFNTTATGFYGEITENSVRRFQGDRGITANGLVGATTLGYLLSSFSNPSTSTPSVPLVPSNSILSLNSYSPEVGLLQQRLQQLRLYFGPINSFFDINTQQAVIRFQQANSITPTGQVDPTTKAFLFPGQGTLPGTLAAVQLRPGDRGLSVRLLQSFLNRLGYQVGSVDGIFGTSTELAVRQLQQDLGVIPTGAITENTLLALRNYLTLPQIGSTQNYLGTPQLGSTQNYLGVSQVGSTQNGLNSAQQSFMASSSWANNPSQVLQIQRRLNLQGLYYGPFDGIYNFETREAVARARQIYGISATDLVAPPLNR